MMREGERRAKDEANGPKRSAAEGYIMNIIDDGGLWKTEMSHRGAHCQMMAEEHLLGHETWLGKVRSKPCKGRT